VIDSNELYITKYKTTDTIGLDAAPSIQDDKIMIPIEYVAQSLGLKVNWDTENNIMYVGPYDVDATGDYEGYKMLLNHEYDGLFDIYFNVDINGSISSYDIKTVPLTTQDMDEVISFTFPDGTTETLTRGQWYSLFGNISSYNYGTEALYKIFGDFYFDWVKVYRNPNPANTAERYINSAYLHIRNRSEGMINPDTTFKFK
jgi:hypothetical protein